MFAGTQQILSLLSALRAKLGNNSNELRVMNNLFNNVQFQDSVSLYNKVLSYRIKYIFNFIQYCL